MYDILITGGTGFVRSNLLQAYKNKKVLLISREKLKLKVNLSKFSIIEIILI